MKAFLRLVITNVLLVIPTVNYAQQPWQQTGSLPGASWPNQVRSLAAIGDNIFAGTTAGIYYSSNNGLSWTPRNGNLNLANISAVYALASEGSDLFASLSGSVGAGGIFKSSDLGITWTNITPPGWTAGKTEFVFHNGYVYAGIYGGSAAHLGVQKSPLAGINSSSWTSFNTGFATQPNVPMVSTLAIMGTSIIVGTWGQGMWISPASTAAWVPFGPSLNYFSCLGVNEPHIFAGTLNPAVYRSPDYGATWTPSSTPVFGSHQANALVVNGNKVYAGVTNIGVLVSDDNGVTWSTFSEGLLDPTNPSGWHCNGISVMAMVVKDSTLFIGTAQCGVWKRSLNSIPSNTISGNVFYDANSNGTKDTTEPHYRPVTVQHIHGTDTSTVINPFGKFNTKVDTGTYKTRVLPSSPFHTVNPVMETSTFTTYNNIDTVAFAIQPVPGKRDMAVQIFAMGPARPGFPVTYKLLYGNKGTDTAEVEVKLVKSNKLNFVSSSIVPANAVADTLRWTIPALKPLQGGDIIVNFTVQPPPGVVFNDTLVSVATITSNATDLMPVDNTSCLRQRVTGSYDPNDKKEIHDGRILRSAIADGEKLQYTIRFQNTGNDTAFNIFVKDTLSAKLDWNSLEMVSASHDYKLTINNGICTWHFDNIHLVDSNHNEPLSHGYLAFKIAARSSVVAGDVIQNRASIYFDYNLPVVTNTETTAIITQVFPVKLVSFTATKRSSDNLLQWLVEKQTNFSHYNVERSGNGRDFTRIATIPGGPNEFSFADDKFAPALNYYRLKMVDVDGKTEYSPVQRVNNAGSMDVTLYPNPAKDILQLRIESITPRSIELEVISPDGRVIIRKVISLPGGISVTPVRIDPLSKGSYVLKINHGDEAPVVLRFQKQ